MIIETHLSDSAVEKIRFLISHLPIKEADIIKKLYGIEEEEQTLKQVAEQYHVSRDRIIQIRNRAIRRMRSRAARYYDTP